VLVVRATRCLAAVLALAGAAAGCSKEIPARPDPQAIQHRTAALGDRVDDFGIEVAVIAVAAYQQSDDGFPRVAVTMRSQSSLDAPWQNPDVTLRCEESSEPGEWYAESTWEPNGILPGGQINEGRLIVAFPPKPDADEYPVPTCTHPAIEVTGTDRRDRDRQIITRYPVPSSVIDQAIDAPRA
jgi:hypothetical protein